MLIIPPKEALLKLIDIAIQLNFFMTWQHVC